MSAGTHTPGPWQVRPGLVTDCATYYTVSRLVPSGAHARRVRQHMKLASDGRPMLYSLAQAHVHIAAAKGGAA